MAKKLFFYEIATDVVIISQRKFDQSVKRLLAKFIFG